MVVHRERLDEQHHAVIGQMLARVPRDRPLLAFAPTPPGGGISKGCEPRVHGRAVIAGCQSAIARRRRSRFLEVVVDLADVRYGATAMPSESAASIFGAPFS